MKKLEWCTHTTALYMYVHKNKRYWRDDDGLESVQREEDEYSTREFYPMANLVEYCKLEFKVWAHSYQPVPLSGTGDY